MLELGFDYRKFAIEFYSGAVSIGARENTYFRKNNIGLGRIGLRYQSHKWIFNLLSGSSNSSDFSISLLRANVEWMPNRNYRLVFSAINRNLKFDGHVDDDTSQPRFSVDVKSTTLAAYGYMRFKKRYWGGLMLSAENVSTNSQTKLHPKAGALISLSF